MRKQWRRVRTWLGFALVAVIPIVFAIAFKINPPHAGSGERTGFLDLATHSGINMPLAALSAVSAFLLIVVVSLFAGESLSGEASWGTLRYLLVRPVPRARLLAVKLGVAALLSVVAAVVVSAVGLAAGTAAFGWHPVVTPTLGVFSQGAAVGRLALATVYVAWSMAAFATFAFLVSTMTDSAFGAVAAGVGLGVVSQILDNISALNPVSYVFPTHYLNAWDGLFVTPAQTTDMVRGVLLQIPYAVVFCVLAWWWFARKDVVS